MLEIVHIKKNKKEVDPEVKKLADRLRTKWELADFEKQSQIRLQKKAK